MYHPMADKLIIAEAVNHGIAQPLINEALARRGVYFTFEITFAMTRQPY